mmetsp:Transcript_7217/g.15726  ORF Transcript_7217/g.15726 Transcript_7217/m.15726 type:complete len:1139 (-) Transcript_7217:190-3606(-)
MREILCFALLFIGDAQFSGDRWDVAVSDVSFSDACEMRTCLTGTINFIVPSALYDKSIRAVLSTHPEYPWDCYVDLPDATSTTAGNTIVLSDGSEATEFSMELPSDVNYIRDETGCDQPLLYLTVVLFDESGYGLNEGAVLAFHDVSEDPPNISFGNYRFEDTDPTPGIVQGRLEWEVCESGTQEFHCDLSQDISMQPYISIEAQNDRGTSEPLVIYLPDFDNGGGGTTLQPPEGTTLEPQEGTTLPPPGGSGCTAPTGYGLRVVIETTGASFEGSWTSSPAPTCYDYCDPVDSFQPEGTRSEQPGCYAQDCWGCPRCLDLFTTVDYLSCTSTDEYAVCVPVCLPGYVFAQGEMDSAQVTCYGGRFEPDLEGATPRCISEAGDVCQGEPQQFSGVILESPCVDMTTGSRCTLSCPPGSELFGADGYECDQGTYRLMGATPSCETRSNCDHPPPLKNGGDNSQCVDSSAGYNCPATCQPLYYYTGQITCLGTFWLLGGLCVPEDINTVSRRAVTAFFAVLSQPPPDATDATSVMDYEWAVQNTEGIESMFIESLQYQTISLDIIPLSEVEVRRRLQDSTSSEPVGFTLKVGIYLDDAGIPTPQSEIDSLSAAFQNLLGITSEYRDLNDELDGGFFLQALVQSGQSPPATSAIIYVYQVPTLVSDFPFAATGEWITEAWGECDNTCGDGYKARQVRCSLNVSAYCSGPMPENSTTCEGEDGCPSEALCPLGQDDVPCHTQLIVGVAFLAVCVCACVCCMCFLLKLRRPRKGTVKIRTVHGRPKPLRWAEKQPGDPPYPEGGMAAGENETAGQENNPGALQAKEMYESAGKRHIKWDVDVSELQLWLGPTVEDDEKAGPEEVGPKIELPLLAEAAEEPLPSQSSRLDLPDVPDVPVVPAAHNESILGPDAQLPYKQGAHVEYFSKTTQRWLPAVVESAFVIDRPSEQAASAASGVGRVVYDVRVGQEQLRHEVSLDMLRFPFSVKEPVDAFSEASGKWISVVISGAIMSSTSAGYQVRVPNGPEALSMPAVLLRRRFPAGSRIQLYRGLQRGWVSATVHAAASAGPGKRKPKPLSDFSPGSGPGSRGFMAPYPWVMVPVFETDALAADDSKMEPEPEWVPSYLLQYPEVGNCAEVVSACSP